MTAVDSGSGSATTGTAESTATVVSLPPSTRSSHASVPRHSTGSSPHDACGNPSPNAGLEPAGYSSRWVCTSTIRSPGAPWSTVVAASSSIVDSGGSVNVPPGALDVERVVELEVGPDVEPPLVAGAVVDCDAASSRLQAASIVNVVAMPHVLRRNWRRVMPRRRAFASASSSVRRIVSDATADRGSGAYSPFDNGWKANGTTGSSDDDRAIARCYACRRAAPAATSRQRCSDYRRRRPAALIKIRGSR